MINIQPTWRLQSRDTTQMVPIGVDLEVVISFHDDEGHEFDAVRTNIETEIDQRVR